jgi:hypothetical protein
MTTEIPEALAVLDAGIGALQVCGVKTDAIEQARSAFTAEHEALKDARSELANLPRSLAYEFTHLPKIDKALAAVEKLP